MDSSAPLGANPSTVGNFVTVGLDRQGRDERTGTPTEGCASPKLNPGDPTPMAMVSEALSEALPYMRCEGGADSSAWTC